MVLKTSGTASFGTPFSKMLLIQPTVKTVTHSECCNTKLIMERLHKRFFYSYLFSFLI